MPTEPAKLNDDADDETTPRELSAPPSSDSQRPSASSEPPEGSGTWWRLGGVLRTIRPHQWVKNVFVLAPVVFAKEVFAAPVLTQAAAAFVIFCLTAGAVYTINDLTDVEADRIHPAKRHRPIASGRVPTSWARVLVAVLLAGVIAGGLLVSPKFLLVALTYFALNLAYTFKLKHVAYLDVGCLAAFFVMRVMAGGFATDIQVSKYLLLCTALLALFLGFGKRRHELTSARNQAAAQRVALESYSKRGIDAALVLTAVATVVTYIVYTLDPHTREFFQTDWLWPSAAFVVLGMMRFIHIVRHRPKAESPTQEMLRDGPFVMIVLFWVILVMWVVYQLKPS